MTTLTTESAAGQSGTTPAAGNSGAAAAQTTQTTATTTAQPSWRDSLPDDIKSNPALSAIQDIPSLAKSYVHAQGLVGKKGVFPPGEKSTDEEWTAFYKNIGQPDLDKFEVKSPEGKELNKDLVDWFKKNAHASGLLPKQAQKLLESYVAYESEQTTAQKTAKEGESKAQLANLQKEWGQGYDKNVASAKLAVKEVGGEEFAQYLEKTGLGNDVQIIKLMSNVGKLLGEDRIRGESGGKFGQTPQEIQQSIDKVMGDPKSPYLDKSHPGHISAVREMESLYQKLHA